LELTLLDTPGHIDFASQTEQVLSVLDYAILVVSGSDGVQGYTRTLWGLLKRYQVPTFIFVNKMDTVGSDKQKLIADLKEELSDGCIDFSKPNSQTQEEIAMQDDDILEGYLETGDLSDETIKKMISQRKIFPCYFGSSLKLDGIDEFLDGILKWTIEKQRTEEFGARVFKISHDEKMNV
jgi:small GTP-binding protein domain